jgi:hypothetical protein
MFARSRPTRAATFIDKNFERVETLLADVLVPVVEERLLTEGRNADAQRRASEANFDYSKGTQRKAK